MWRFECVGGPLDGAYVVLELGEDADPRPDGVQAAFAAERQFWYREERETRPRRYGYVLRRDVLVFTGEG